MIKLVAFDWNGTIIADTEAILKGVEEVVKTVGIFSVSLKKFQKHFDVPVTKTYLGLGVPEEILQEKAAEFAKIFHNSYEPRVAKVRTRAFAKQLLNYLFKSNIPAVIFSNHIDEPIKRQLKRLKLEKYFSHIIANSELTTALHKRSKKDKLKDYLKNKGLLPNEVLIVGDTIEEIEIGKEIGAITVALTHGNCSIARLKTAKPDYLVGNLHVVETIIRKNNEINP